MGGQCSVRERHALRMKSRIWLCACLFREIWDERGFLDHITQKKGLRQGLLCSFIPLPLLGEPVVEYVTQQGMVLPAQLTVHSQENKWVPCPGHKEELGTKSTSLLQPGCLLMLA